MIIWWRLVVGVLAISDVWAQSSTLVTLPHGGSLDGTIMSTAKGRKVNAFLGIPYAKPPIGLLRFKPPMAANPWSGTKPAKTPSAACPQVDIFRTDKIPFGNEDCLYLNVYVPQDPPSNNLPVMVWIHGGAYHMGSSDPQFFGPERILDNNVILVTINYRLGVLGFLSTGTLDASGNYGLKDQNLALQWIKENIQAFGGNANDVTLFGQSAGSSSVSLHMVSDKSKGLFHKAILQAGNFFDPWALIDHQTSIERLKKVGDLVGCPLLRENFAVMISCLQQVPATALVSTIEYFNIDSTYYPITVFGPVIEPKTQDAFLPDDPRTIIDPHGNSIPIVIGQNADEGVVISASILNLHDEHFRENFDSVLPKLLDYDHKPDDIKTRITEKIDNFYFKEKHDWSKRNHFKLSDMFTDRLFSFGMDQYLRNRFYAMNIPTAKTYLYIFAHRGPTSVSQQVGGGPGFYGVCHGDELPFLFIQGQENMPESKADQLIKWALPKLWTDFATHGNPTPDGTNIREFWNSTDSFPLNFVTIRNYLYSASEFREISGNSYEATDVSSPDFDANRHEEQSYNNYRRRRQSVVTPSSSSTSSSSSSSTSSDESSEETTSREINILKNEVGLYEKRIKFWRSLEKLLY